MQSLVEQMSVYQRYHTNEITKMTHYVGASCIIFATLLLLSWVHLSVPGLFSTNFAWIAIIAAIIYYLFLDVLLAIVAAVVLLPITYLAQLCAQPNVNVISGIVFLIFFIGGWIMLFVGYYFEGRRSPFMDTLFHIIAAPLFMTAELFFVLGYKKTLQKKIQDMTQGI